ncbi:hydroxymethylbilane synthase [Clostridium tetani]|uniref:hydroxymethylbilane synthase n=1 Tax=Clostridium tetani TaxID=1513 RepID=UPI000D207B40|nr:hydroxymethylbilane synthase [Clostridium tetani]AVP55874.1 hydroxymethylbilane synthase [Clostridium tetani]RXI44771.1 hydroxymethylbilane synthase [Clostridium tetani]RXI52297.1 hydroxymethylbilane synthase [Clostridium tetani]RXI52735.1 hydroxymethylbilane synthase [Clostridium tetani]RXI76073.1 hydroxymethylbilane synthase [Clostridium tetani]
MKLIVATRRSILAQTQTDLVIKKIEEDNEVKCEKLLIQTLGDKILDRTLDKIGGKGLFIKEIEKALLDGKAHMAVHSMKDVPYEVPSMFYIGAIPRREDVRDAFVSRDGTKFMELPSGSKIGTSSRRRASQIKILRPDVEVVPIRGNVQTRLRKIEEMNLAGTILAVAGLKRLNMEEVITDYFSPEEMVPAIGQGALGIEIKKYEDVIDYIKGIDHEETRICVEGERSFMEALKGDCHSTIGAHAIVENDLMYMTGIFEVNGKIVKKDIEGKKENYKQLGKTLADRIMKA